MATERMDIPAVRASVPAGDKGWQGAPENSIVGHVHLRVGDPAAAEDWWHRTLGFDTVAKYGAQAVFLSTGGYHHHIGANTWQSAGAGKRDRAGQALPGSSCVRRMQATKLSIKIRGARKSGSFQASQR